MCTFKNILLKSVLILAPEIITSRSYSQQCDVWAVGVIMYTLLSGRYPFYSTKEQELTEMICNEEPLLSGLSASYGALHLIRKILVKNPALRITAAEMSQHPWIIGKPMTLDENSTDNVLDMMRLWRSELMVQIGFYAKKILITNFSFPSVTNAIGFRLRKL